MGISSRFVRKFLAAKPLVVGIWLIVLSPWLLLWFVQSPMGTQLWISYINEYLEQKESHAQVLIEDVHFDPRESLSIQQVTLSNEIPLCSLTGLSVEWGIRKGIHVRIQDLTVQSDMSAWGMLLSSEESTASEPFSWKGMAGYSIPFSVELDSVVVLSGEEQLARMQWRMYGDIVETIDVQDIFVELKVTDVPKVSVQGRVQYYDTSIIIPNMSVDSSGLKHRFSGQLDVSLMAFDMVSATHISKYGLRAWIEQELPGEEVFFSNHLVGNLDSVQSRANVEVSSAELPMDMMIHFAEQKWSVEARPQMFSLTKIAPQWVQDTIVNGVYTVSGTGFQLDSLALDVQITGDNEKIWSEDIAQWSLQAQKQQENVEIQDIQLRHVLGDIHASGNANLLEEHAHLNISLDIPSLLSLEGYGVPAAGRAHYNGTLGVFWKDVLRLLIHGELQGEALSYEGYRVENFMSNIDLSYQEGHVQGNIELDSYNIDAETLQIGQLYSNVSVEYTSDVVAVGQYEMYGLDINKQLFLDRLAGEIDVAGVQSITTKGTTEGLVFFEEGAQLDAGAFFVDYHAENLYSELLLENESSPVLNMVVSAQLDKGEWKLGAFDFHPLSDLHWELQGPAFYYTQGRHKGKGQLHLVSRMGEIHLNILKERASLDVLGLELQSLEQLASYFVGTDVLEGDFSGRLFLEAKLNHMDFVEGKLRLVDVSVADYVQHINIDSSLSGRILHPVIDLRAFAKRDMIRIHSSIPMNNDYSFDCTKEFSVRVAIPSYSLHELHQILPIVPAQDTEMGASLRISRTICDPEIQLSVQGTYPVGDEKVSLESYVHRDEDIFIRTSILRAFVPKVSLLGTINGSFTDFFTRLALVKEMRALSEVVHDLDIRLVSTDFSLAQLLQMYSITASVQGFLHGDISIKGEANAPLVTGALWIEEGMMGGIAMNNPKIEISTNTDGYLYTGHVGLEKGEAHMNGSLSREFDSMSLDIDSEDIPLRSMLGIVSDVTEGVGSFSLNGYLRGPFDSLDHSLRLQIKKGGFSYRKANVAVEDINLDAIVETDTIRFLSCAMKSISLRTKEYGTASLNGTMRKEGFSLRSGNLKLSLSKFWLLDRSDQSYRFSGDMLARYLPEGVFDFSGAIELNQGRLILDSSFFTDESTQLLDSKIHLYTPQAQFLGTDALTETEESWMQISDIRVDLNQQLYMTAEFPLIDQYNKELSMLSTAYVDGVFDGEITLKMDAASLSLEGDVEAVRGDLKAMGATFAMSEAKLSFLGKDYSNPIMDILATRTIDSYDVSTSLTGTVALPKIAFSSTSATPLSQTDLISLILFGRVSSELGDNNPLLSSVMTSLSGSMNQLLGSSLVDRFSWDPSSQQIEIGVALSEKLYFNVTQLYQGQNQDIQSQTVLGLEWFIMKRMYMEMLSNPKSGSVSGYVFYRWRY